VKIGEIRELIRLLDETSLTELKLETGDAKLLLKKGGDTVAVSAAPAPAVSTLTAPAVTHAAAAAADTSSQSRAESAPESSQEDEAGIHYITAPMVGTFYRAPAPDADPYVSKGHQVNANTVVCIVEAMKLMNEIEAEVDGEVVDVLVENGQLVEYGQPLYKIKLS
jgi:acetyl-CoA carboxylase biotin carboxyl carrier protein